MESIDKLLAQIKAEYQESDKSEQPKKQQPLPKKAKSGGLFRDGVPPSPPQLFKTEASLDSLLGEVEAESMDKQQLSQKNQPSKNSASLDSLLNDIKADYEAQEGAEQQLRLEQLKAQEQRQQQRHQQELEKLRQRAIAWLKQLDPLSSEGLWFENFAQKYDSKLEAAIAYLQTN